MPDETYYGKLFDFLESEFGITPIITEMNDLIEVVRSLPRYKPPGHVIISRECAEEAIDGFRRNINDYLPYRDRITDKESDFYKKYDSRIKHCQSMIDEISAALEAK